MEEAKEDGDEAPGADAAIPELPESPESPGPRETVDMRLGLRAKGQGPRVWGLGFRV